MLLRVWIRFVWWAPMGVLFPVSTYCRGNSDFQWYCCPPKASSIHSESWFITLLLLFLFFSCRMKELKQVDLQSGSSVGRWTASLNSPFHLLLPQFCESQIVFTVKNFQGKNTYFCGYVMLYDHILVQLLLHVQLAEPVTGIFTLTCK